MALLWLEGVAYLVTGSSCGFIAAIKLEAVLCLLWLYSGNKARSCVYTYAYIILFVLMEESSKSLQYIFLTAFSFFIGNPISKGNKHTFLLESRAQLLQQLCTYTYSRDHNKKSRGQNCYHMVKTLGWKQ